MGQNLVERLRELGHLVEPIDVKPPAKEDRVGAVDIRRQEELLPVFEDLRPEVVFHLAAMANARSVLKQPGEAMSISSAGTAALLNVAVHAGVGRVVVGSSVWVDSALVPNGGIDGPLAASGGGHIYTTSMIVRELLAYDFWSLYGLPFTIFRYSPLYGPGMWPGLAVRSFLEAAAEGGPIVVHGDGLTRRCFLHVDDLIDALVLGLMEEAANQRFVVRGPDAVSVRELADIVSELYGGLPIVSRPALERVGQLTSEAPLSGLEKDKARSMLGWAPTIDIREGLSRLVPLFTNGAVE